MVRRRLKLAGRRNTRRYTSRALARGTYRGYSRPTYRRRRTGTGRRNVSSVEVIKQSPFLLGQVDPFVDSVKGLKIPDQNTMQSETLCVQDEFSLIFPTPTTTQNVRAYLFNPSPTSAFVEATYGTGSWSWVGAFGGGQDLATATNIQTQYEAYRTGAHGVRISSPVAPTTATGFVHVCIYAPSTFGQSTWPFPTTVGQMRDLPWYRKMTLAALTQNPLTIVNKFLDQTAFRYVDPEETFAGFANTGRGNFHITHSWATILVAVEGVPSNQTVLTAETIHHFESLPKFGSSSAANPAAPSSPVHMEAAARISQQAQATHTESEQTSVLSQASQALNGMGSSFISGAAAIGQRAAYAAGQTAVTMGVQALTRSSGIAGVNDDQYRLTEYTV